MAEDLAKDGMKSESGIATDSESTESELTPLEHERANVDVLQFGDTTLHLIGTAHVSRQSAELVTRVINDLKPDVVCVELCSPRYESLLAPDRWKETDIVQVIKSGRAYVLLGQLIMAGFQKKVARQFGIEAGAEMKAALKSAGEVDAQVIPIDREIKITLKRAWASASLWTLGKIVASAIDSLTSRENLTERQIEELKVGDALSSVLCEFAEQLPEVKRVLIDERDRFMAIRILRAVKGSSELGPVGVADSHPRTVVAVVGAGHVPGMRQSFALYDNGGESISEPQLRMEEASLKELEVIPAPAPWFRFLGVLVPGLVIGGLIAGFFVMDFSQAMNMIVHWILITGTFAAVATAAAAAHPLTVVSAFVSAPITCLHPALAVGWVAGLVEASLRKPRVKDLESLVDDFSGLKGLWRNRVSKILLVVIFANLGGALGAIIGLTSLSKLW